MKLNNSAIVYEGASLIDGQPVVAIATGFLMGNNSKLGSNVVQVWVMRSDLSPVEAIKTEQDYSVCGDCPLRGKVCYVNLTFAPTQIYRTYKRGGYEPIGDRHLQRIKDYGKVLRLTAYGDIAAIPKSAIAPLINSASHTIGYTHQWRASSDYKGIVMASCESVDDVKQARAIGWQTFRVKAKSDPLLPQEQACTNQTNKAIQCEDCKLCDGKTKSVAVDVHGLNWKLENYKKLTVAK